MEIPPELRKTIDEITADLTTLRLPVHIAAATLPIEKEIQHELHRWHAELPLKWEQSGHPRPEFFVSLTSDLQRLTWHTAGDTEEFSGLFHDYLEGYPIGDPNLADMEATLAAVSPAQLGTWISAQPQSFEIGWYCAPRDNLLANAIPHLPQTEQLKQVGEWAERYGVTRCLRLGRSLVSHDQLSELFLPVDAGTPHRSLELSLILFRHLGIDYPRDAVLSALFHQDFGETIVSLWFGLDGLAKIGIMLAEPTASQFLRLNNALGFSSEAGVAMFEGCLGIRQAAYLEYQQTGSGEAVELHYAAY